MRRSGWLFLTAVAFLVLEGCARPAELALQPGQWDFGTISSGSPVELRVEVANPGRSATAVRLISTCACLVGEPPEFTLARGARTAVRLRYDPSEDEGDIRMQIIVRSGEGTRALRQVLRVFGRVVRGAAGGAGAPAGAPAAEAPQRREASAGRGAPQLSFEYFYDPGCKGCEVFLARQMVALQQELGIRLQVSRHDISQAATREAYVNRLEALGIPERAYPAVVFGDAVLQGDEEIAGEFKRVLRSALEGAVEGSER